MGIRSRLLTGLLALPLLLNGGVALAQDGGSVASLGEQLEPININLENPEGDVVATAAIWETAEGVHFTVLSVPGGTGSEIERLEPGEPGVYIYEVGICDPADGTVFESAGDLFDPTAVPGGLEDDDDDIYAAYLGEMTVGENGRFQLDVTVDELTLEPGAENSLAGPSGAAIVIRENEDDVQIDPIGESGERIACGVIYPPEGAGGTPAAGATPEATPDS